MNYNSLRAYAPDPIPITVAEVVRLYLDDVALRLQANKLKPKSAAKASNYCESFAKQFGKLQVDQARRQDLIRWLLSNEEWQSDHTRSDAVQSVVSCFRWAVRERLISHNPYADHGIEFDLQPRQAMTGQQYAAMMRAGQVGNAGRPSSGRAMRRALFFLRRSGARTCEMREAKWTDFDPDAGCLTLWEHKTKRTSQTSRIIGLEPCLLRFLKNLARRRSPFQERIFVNGRGKPWKCNSFARLFRAYAQGAGVPDEVSAYAARHLFCVTALEAGVGERQVADAMGHASTRYVHWYGRSCLGHAKYLRNVASEAMKRKREKG